jgi:DNA-binding IclR family transcriptional regulator
MPRTVPAVLSAIRILAVLNDRDRIPVGLTQIAREVGMYNGTCDDILHTLESHGYVVRDPATRGYLLGPALVGLGAKAVSDPDYVQVALERLLAVRDNVRANCHLVQLVGGEELQVVGRLEVPFGLGIGAQVGQRFPIFASRAAGRAFLAWMAEDERRSLFDRFAERGFFAEFGGDRHLFEADLARVRGRGYDSARAVEYVERSVDLDLYAILAAPIFDHAGRVALVASVIPFGSQAADDLLPGHAASLLATTGAITQAIGGKLPADYPRPGQEGPIGHRSAVPIG